MTNLLTAFSVVLDTQPPTNNTLSINGNAAYTNSQSVTLALGSTGALKMRISENGDFSWEEVECLGACVNAPVVQINDDFYEDMDSESTKKLLEALKRNAPPPVGSMIGRKNSAPEGGPRRQASNLRAFIEQRRQFLLNHPEIKNLKSVE